VTEESFDDLYKRLMDGLLESTEKIMFPKPPAGDFYLYDWQKSLCKEPPITATFPGRTTPMADPAIMIELLKAVKEWREKDPLKDIPKEYVAVIHPDTWEKAKQVYLDHPYAQNSMDGASVLGRLPYITLKHPTGGWSYCALTTAVGVYGPHLKLGDAVLTKAYAEWLQKKHGADNS
jgi:hypothetical protein